MAGMVIASAPMVILYIAFQKYFVRGLDGGRGQVNPASADGAANPGTCS